ncbi:MAG TPA: hypothetical protein DIT31_07980 [Methylophaga sp.]|nr:hypothetical protein [Methylophaga sp.]
MEAFTDEELLMAGLATYGSGIGGYYGAKALSKPSDISFAEPDSPFIERPPPEIPDVEGGFGSPAQRRAASEASAGSRGVRKAVNPQDLYVPEFAPDGSRQPLDYEGRSRFRDRMKTPGVSNPNKGKLFDYVPEGTVSLLEEEARLQKSAEEAQRAMNSNVLSTREKIKAANAFDEAGKRIGSLRNVINEMGGMDSEIVRRQYQSGPASRISFGSGPIPFGREAVEFEASLGGPSSLGGQSSDYQAVNELRELDKIINDRSRPFNERVRAQMAYDDVAREAGKRYVRDFDDRYEKSERARKAATRDFGFEDDYRKMAADDFSRKIDQGLDNARRYLDESFVARELMTKQPVPGASTGPGGPSLSRMKRVGSTVAAAMGAIPDPTDLAILGMAGPLEMMYGTEIGQEPGTGTFGIPLATTLGKASELVKRPLVSRDINVDTRIRLADDDYPLASQLHSEGVLSAEAFDIITRIRKARGGDTTVLPLLKAEPEAPEPGPAMGRPGRRF